ncbi:MAG: hypothetical protein ACI9PY_002673 [Ascidiaceihabitans sp.]|jgi:hypothetical protein
MKISVLSVTALLLTLSSFGATAQQVEQSEIEVYRTAQQYACGKTCGRVRSCEEAVYQWCVCGYSRADGDNDGVPCEKLCGQSTRKNLDRVRRYKQQFGCR